MLTIYSLASFVTTYMVSRCSSGQQWTSEWLLFCYGRDEQHRAQLFHVGATLDRCLAHRDRSTFVSEMAPDIMELSDIL